jgi:formate hydrogenlyase transcriptional activator
MQQTDMNGGFDAAKLWTIIRKYAEDILIQKAEIFLFFQNSVSMVGTINNPGAGLLTEYQPELVRSSNYSEEISTFRTIQFRRKNYWENKLTAEEFNTAFSECPQSTCYIPAELKYAVKAILVLHISSIAIPEKIRRQLSDHVIEIQDEVQLIIDLQSSNGSVLSKIMSVAKREYELSILQKLGQQFTAVRNKPDLLKVLEENLLSISLYYDAGIIIAEPEKDSYHIFLYAPQKERYKDPNYRKLISKNYQISGSYLEDVLKSKEVVTFDLETLYHAGELDEQLVPIYTMAGVVEIKFITLRDADRPIGALYLMSTGGRKKYNYEELQFMLVMANQLSSVVANILTNEAYEEKERENQILLDLSNDMTSVRTKADLYNVISEKLCKIALFGELVIGLINEDKVTRSAYIYRSATAGKFHEHPGFSQASVEKYPIADGIMDVVMASVSHVVFDMDILMCRLDKPPYIPFWHSYGMREMVGLPLRAANEDIAVLWIYLTERGTLTPYHLALLKGVSSQIATAMVNIKANDKIESQLREISSYKQQLEQENSYLISEISGGLSYSDLVGCSVPMQKVFQHVEQVAKSNSTVLILGETGTGKELIARAIHNGSDRKTKLMIKVNCAALPANLIESELFGHERGSFTGATERRIGKFELANNGTLFLDEIGELPLELQVKLLRVLQEKEVERIGGSNVIKINVRVIAATNRNLVKEVADGNFRSDLFYRLYVFPITIPALREHKEDIPLLTYHFISRFTRNTGKKVDGISRKAEQSLMTYDWPGNVRELEHLIERSILSTQGPILKHIQLPVAIKDISYSKNPEGYTKTIEENERDHILNTLRKCNGKIFGAGGAAELLKMHVSTLNARIRKLGIKKDHYFIKSAEVK